MLDQLAQLINQAEKTVFFGGPMSGSLSAIRSPRPSKTSPTVYSTIDLSPNEKTTE